MPEKEKPETNHDSFEVSIYKFMNYSSGASFYGVLTASLFFSAMTLNNLFSETLIKENPLFETIQISFLSSIALVVGLLFWRASVNRMDSKASIKHAISLLSSKTDIEKAKKLTSSLQSYRKLGIEKLRKVRLFSSFIASIYMLFLSFRIVNPTKPDEAINLLSGISAIYLIFIILGISVSVIITFFINKSFHKGIQDSTKKNEEQDL